MKVYIVYVDRQRQRDIDTVFANLDDAKAYVLNVYKVTAVYQRPGLWACFFSDIDIVWIKRFPVRGGR